MPVLTPRIRFCLFLALGISLSVFNSSLQAQCDFTAPDPPKNGVDNDCDGLDDLYLHMPTHIYMVEGKPFDLFVRNIFISQHPFTYQYAVQTTLPGTLAGDHWSFTPAAAHVGEHSFTVQIKDGGGAILASASSVVRVAAAQTPANVGAKKIILLGHSLVDQGIMPYYLHQMTNEPGNPAITHHGTHVSWSDNLTRHEGKGGSSWRWFAHDTASPLVFNNALNLRRYFDGVLCNGCNPDFFVIQLDINDFCVQGLLDGSTFPEINGYIDQIYQADILPIVSAIRAASPGTKIGICLTPPANDRPNVFVNHFGAQSILANTMRWKKIVNTVFAKYTQYFGSRTNENIYILPIHMGVDNINHYDDIDPWHPFPNGAGFSTPNGYLPIARSLYGWMKNMMAAPTGSCALNATLKNINPNDNGTPALRTDDTFDFDLNVHGTNTGATWLATVNGQAVSGTVGTDKKLGPFPATGTPQVFEVRAQNNANCKTTVSVSAPPISNGAPVKVDLQTVITSTNLSPGLFTTFRATLTVTNNSANTAQGVFLKVPKAPEAAFGSASPVTVSQGVFDWYYSFIWNVGNIPPNGSATLSLDYYLLQNTPFTLYAQVTAVLQPDVDSKPANGNGATSLEDDEAALRINGPATGCSPDATAPVIAGCPANISATIPGTSAPASWAPPTATDNCPGSVALTGTHAPGATFAIGTTTVTYTARDAANNSAQCSFSVNLTQQATGGTCTANLLDNPGFENNLTDWYGTGGTISTDAAPGGTKSLRLCAGQAVRQTKPITAGKTLTLTFKAKSAAAGAATTGYIKYLSAAWQPLVTEFLAYTGTAAYATATLSKIAPTGTAWVETGFVTGSPGCILLDDICLSDGGGTGTGGGQQPDLQLTLAAAPQNPGQWGSTALTLTLTNIGAATATGVTVDFLNQSNPQVFGQIGYQSHNAPAGTEFNSWTGLWTLGTINPGETKRLIYNAFTKVATQIPVFAQVKTASPADADSAPGNNTTGAPSEDDEARTVLNVNQPVTLAPGDREEDLEPLDMETLPDFTLFPNPAAEKVLLKTPGDFEGKILILNQLGMPVHSSTPQFLDSSTFEIDLSGFQNGQYFVALENPGARRVVKKLSVVRNY